ncbi:hypothetical protein F5B20DRAFT_586723 [Whalleya microplaca]|nr:hypothetical protein F5B20DRAFT_586723 [Whalleya microplaca]
MAQDSSSSSSPASSEPRLRGPPPGATAPPEHVAKPQVYEIFHGSRPEDSPDIVVPPHPDGQQQKNPGQQQHQQPGIKEGFESIKTADFLHVHRVPCAREGFLTGIGAGAVAGMGRYVAGARIPKAANWAFGVFFLGSIIQWEYCRAQRAKEHAAMARVVEVMDRKQAEKKAQMEEAARLRQEERARQEAEKKKSWYKFW